MKTCDICKKESVVLISLREIYRTDGVSECCPDCEKILNKHLHKLQSDVSQIQISWFKRFITNLVVVVKPKEVK